MGYFLAVIRRGKTEIIKQHSIYDYLVPGLLPPYDIQQLDLFAYSRARIEDVC
jgi:hypothetical protein